MKAITGEIDYVSFKCEICGRTNSEAWLQTYGVECPYCGATYDVEIKLIRNDKGQRKDEV